MALGIDREKYNAMVNYFRNNIGGVLAVDQVKAGEVVLNSMGVKVTPVRATKEKEELFIMVDHYLRNYNQYPDEPLVEFDNEKEYLFIKNGVK